ncbi:MAG TPA: hypothetical protein VKW06_16150 [Candidatus Angelobacter sp.]|nr:hypothetical protein [Candidatus Angelobacter sp.]
MFNISFVVIKVAQSLAIKERLIITLYPDFNRLSGDVGFERLDEQINIVVRDNPENRTVFGLGKRINADFNVVEPSYQKAG